MPNYTPKPWWISDTGPKWSINSGSGGDSGKHIAMVSCYQSYKGENEENIANARLIAAAPDLLTALETLIEDCEQASGSMDYNYGEFDLQNAKAAIAKAKGK